MQKINMTITVIFSNCWWINEESGSCRDADCYRELMDDALGTPGTGKNGLSAAPIVAQLRKGLEAMTGKKVEMTMEEDASFLGGVVVSVGDTLYDGSIRTQLNNMRNLLGEEI